MAVVQSRCEWLRPWRLQRSGSKWSDSRYILTVELSALANGLDIDDEGSSELHPELLSKWGEAGAFADMQTGRGAGLRKETKTFIYSLDQYLLSPY